MGNLDDIEKNHLEQHEANLDYDEQKKQLFEQELSASIKAGRYTLELASVYIERNSRTDMHSILKALMESVRNGELKTYAPGSDGPYRSKVVREFYEEVFWDDLNDWLKNNWPRLSCSFPKPERNTEQAEAAEGLGANTKAESDRTKCMKSTAREIGEQWMEAERKEGKDPGVNVIAKHVEAELKRLDERGPRGDYWDWQTIKREALKGITGRPANGKRQKS